MVPEGWRGPAVTSTPYRSVGLDDVFPGLSRPFESIDFRRRAQVAALMDVAGFHHPSSRGK